MDSVPNELITGDGRIVTESDIADLWRDCCSLSEPTSGEVKCLTKDTLSLTVEFKALNYQADEFIKTFKVYHLSLGKMTDGTQGIESVRPVSGIHESIGVSSTSKNGRYLARLKTDPTSPDKQTLQIWDRNRLIRTFNVFKNETPGDIDAHGSITTDPVFSNFTWSPFGQQDKLMYVCQPKRNKQSYFGKNKTPVILDAESAEKEDWGESLNDIVHTIIGIIDISNNFKVTTIDVDDYSLGSPQWLDGGSKIGTVAYKEMPRKLGIIYCNNRESKIMIHNWQEAKLVKEIGGKSQECYYSLRVSNSGDRILYLSNPTFGPHKHPARLNIHDLNDGTTITSEEYFIKDLPRNCFTSDDKNVFLATFNHLYHHMCLYSLEQAQMIKIKFPTANCSILDFQQDVILASGSEVDSTPTVFVAKLNASNINDVVAWHQIEDCIHLEEIDYESFEIQTADKSSFISAILIRPNQRALQPSQDSVIPDNELPTDVIVHGGPCATFLLGYMSVSVLNARLGLKTLLINYRGSSGVTEEYLQSLCGKVGTLDVEDCMHAIRYAVQHKNLDPTKLVISGGSHGGFLSCHLSCQDEFKFTSAVIRNPVVDISSLVFSSDIPDWALTVSLGKKSTLR